MEKILSIKDLRAQFFTRRGAVQALNGVNLDIARGEVIGIVGETGCGKSVLALSIMGLIKYPGKVVGGSLLFKGMDMVKIDSEEMRKIRGTSIAMVFQDPLTYLNPVFTILDQLQEVYLYHGGLAKRILEHKIADLKKELDACSDKQKAESLKLDISELEKSKTKPIKASSKEAKRFARRMSIDMLRLVGLSDPERIAKSYPHELSGGMRQRVMIAMALALEPDLLIADEATTALDVTTQAQILRLLKELKGRMNSSIVIITHDLGVVAQTCQRVAVMYAGRIIEVGPARAIFSDPKHPYTRGLLAAVPRISGSQQELKTISGSVPDLIRPPSGCRFHPRCPFAEKICQEEAPEPTVVEPDHFAECHLYGKLAGKSVS